MIYPTLWIERRRRAGSDLHGQPVLSPPSREKVCPIKLIFDTQHTTVRTDSSGSHGQAYELTANVVLLISPLSQILVDDILTVTSHKVQVVERHARYTVTGRLDHYEIRCTAWV